MRRPTIGLVIVLVGIGTLAGCPGGITITLPGGLDIPVDVTIPTDLVSPDVVQVEVFNDTDFEVVPRIRFDDDSNILAQLAPAEELATGTLEPGDSIQFDIDCDQLGLIFSDEPGQFLPGDDVPIGQADASRILTRDDDYECGDSVLFHFIGNGDGFGVVVSVNGVVVD